MKRSRNRNKAEYLSVEWSGPTARALEKVYGCKSPVALFVSKAREIFIANKISGPPFNPRSYADALNILVQETEGMTLDGTLRKRDDGDFTVCLKKNASKPRKNFTLAHEIAHTFFYARLRNSTKKLGRGQFRPGGGEALRSRCGRTADAVLDI